MLVISMTSHHITYALDTNTMHIDILPDTAKQGSPITIQLSNNIPIDEVKSLCIATRKEILNEKEDRSSNDCKSIALNLYKGIWTAYYGIDLNAATGTITFRLHMKDGTYIDENIPILEISKSKVEFSIPDKLGGNSTSSSQALITNLSTQNKVLASLVSNRRAYFTESFRLPLASNTITDVYGYTRNSSGVSIAHKGTDYRATIGTKVLSINKGRVLYASTLGDYGNTVIVDHGAGIISMYMHLSKIGVKKGQEVKKSELLGKSGETGYALAPHLHLSIRIGGVSIDPEQFFTLN